MIVIPQPADTGVVGNKIRALHRAYPFLRVVPVGASVLG